MSESGSVLSKEEKMCEKDTPSSVVLTGIQEYSPNPFPKKYLKSIFGVAKIDFKVQEQGVRNFKNRGK